MAKIEDLQTGQIVRWGRSIWMVADEPLAPKTPTGSISVRLISLNCGNSEALVDGGPDIRAIKILDSCMKDYLDRKLTRAILE